MTGTELAAARTRLGSTVEQLAADLGLTPAIVEAWERGRLRIPADTAQLLTWRVAQADRKAILDASGLAECDEMRALTATATASLDAPGGGWSRVRAAVEAVNTHAERCPVCLARTEYLERHAPPLPPLPRSWWGRSVDRVVRLLDRLPRGLRPPAGDAGDGRRIGMFTAAALSAWALFVCALVLIQGLVAGRGLAVATRDVGTVPLIVVGYFVGFYLAGLVYDATRPIRHRLVGYVLRGGIGTSAVYGTIYLVMSLADGKGMSGMLDFVAIFAVGGGVIGGLLWVIDRVRGRLPAHTA